MLTHGIREAGIGRGLTEKDIGYSRNNMVALTANARA